MAVKSSHVKQRVLRACCRNQLILHADYEGRRVKRTAPLLQAQARSGKHEEQCHVPGQPKDVKAAVARSAHLGPFFGCVLQSIAMLQPSSDCLMSRICLVGPTRTASNRALSLNPDEPCNDREANYVLKVVACLTG